MLNERKIINHVNRIEGFGTEYPPKKKNLKKKLRKC